MAFTCISFVQFVRCVSPGVKGSVNLSPALRALIYIHVYIYIYTWKERPIAKDRERRNRFSFIHSQTSLRSSYTCIHVIGKYHIAYKYISLTYSLFEMVLHVYRNSFVCTYRFLTIAVAGLQLARSTHPRGVYGLQNVTYFIVWGHLWLVRWKKKKKNSDRKQQNS